MSTKRRDSKGRVLRDRENQRNDGRYEYKYTDAKGVRRSVYSWKLVDTDKAPEGKKCKNSLREMEKQIERDLSDGIDTLGAKNITLDEWFECYMDIRRNLKPSTAASYRQQYKSGLSPYIGNITLDKLTPSAIRNCYSKLSTERKLNPNTIRLYHNLLKSMLFLAVRENYIRTDPSLYAIEEAIGRTRISQEKKHALTENEQRAFICYVSSKKAFRHWLPFFIFLLGTGCRVGEAIGLTWDDCDFENNIININHAVYYYKQDNGKMSSRIMSPKTENGIRSIPMLKEVREALLIEKEGQLKRNPKQVEVDGYKNFVFVNRNGNLHKSCNIDKTIERIRNRYNEEIERNSKSEHSQTLLPHFSAHNLRHTFCTRYCENESDIKIVQEIMGHANAQTTINVYNQTSLSRKIDSFAGLEHKIVIL